MRERRTTMWLLLGVFVLGGSAPAFAAGGSLSVRMLEADNSDKPSSPSVTDIAPMLQRTLRFSSYRLLATRRMVLRDGEAGAFNQGVTVRFSEVSDKSLTVEVRKGKQRILHTRLLLRRGKPVVLGGIPGEAGTSLILVFILP